MPRYWVMQQFINCSDSINLSRPCFSSDASNPPVFLSSFVTFFKSSLRNSAFIENMSMARFRDKWSHILRHWWWQYSLNLPSRSNWSSSTFLCLSKYTSLPFSLFFGAWNWICIGSPIPVWCFTHVWMNSISLKKGFFGLSKIELNCLWLRAFIN